MRQVNWIVY